MAQPGTVPITAPIDTTAIGDTYPSHKASRGLDDSAVASFAALASIAAPRLSVGMERYAILEGEWYQLQADLTTWSLSRSPAVPANVMLKSDYDPNGDFSVIASDTLQGASLVQVRNLALMTGALPQANVTGLVVDLAAKIPLTQKGASSGVVPLRIDQTIDPIYLPATLPLNPVIAWDVVTNTPSISDAGGTNGDVYVVYGSANPTARDLGSGSINFDDGDTVLFDNGTSTFKNIGGIGIGVSQITTALGVQTGPVTIDDTSYVDPSTDRNYLTDDQLAAFPTGADASDQLVKQSDLTAAIVVGNSYFMPELFANGETLGDGTFRTLTSLGYTNGSAAAIWTRVNSAYVINVNTMDIDWIAWQEACLVMQLEMYSALSTPGGRGYCPYNTIYLPREQNIWSGNRRSLGFKFDFNLSRFNNLTGNSFPIFERYPVNQAEATSNFLSFRYFFKDAYFEGNDSTSENDCFIKLGATVGARFDNIEAQGCGMAIDTQFCMQSRFTNINVVAYGKYAIAIRDGLWTGAGANTAQCNNAWVEDFRSVHGSGKAALAGIYVQGNRNTNIKQATFEGFSGAETQILYSQPYPPSGTLPGTVKNVLYMESIDFEGAGASRAAIRVLGNNVYSELNRYNSQIPPADTLVLYELCAVNGINGGMTADIHGANNYNPGYKFRQIRSGGPTHKWYVEKAELNNNSSLIAPENWDTAFAGSSIPTTYSYTPILP